jgi:predicted RNase H-like HicB family nuclease
VKPGESFRPLRLLEPWSELTTQGANVGYMDAPNTPASAERQVFPEADFREWLDEEGTPALISTSRDQYYAYCVKFGIAGSGKTQDEAIQDATELLMRYLMVSFLEGRPYRASKKRPPLRIRLQTWFWELQQKFQRITPPLSHVGRLISVPTAASNYDAHPLVH